MKKIYYIPGICGGTRYAIQFPKCDRVLDYWRGGKPLQPTYVDDSGYLSINLQDNRYPRGNRTYRFHELVWLAFYGHKPKELVVDHKDGNKFNNHYSNLQLITQAENTRKSKHSGRKPVTLVDDASVEHRFKTIAEAVKFLMGITGKSERACSGKFQRYDKYIFGFKVIYEKGIPDYMQYSPKNKLISLFEED